MPLPCGKCPPCKKRRTSGWSFRLVKEGERSNSALFITLTYDTEYVPITKNGFMSLNKRDVQLFLKRLRKLNPHDKLKYYLCGEYGGDTRRPHYHLIIFNCDISKINPACQKGEIHYGQVSAASVGYTLKYMSKPKTQKKHARDDRVSEFALMSKGLGKTYITPQMVQWHKNALKSWRVTLETLTQKAMKPGRHRTKDATFWHWANQSKLGTTANADTGL